MQVSSFKVTVKILSCYNLGMSLYSVPSLLFINFVLCTINLLERYVASKEILRGRRREGMEGEKNKISLCGQNLTDLIILYDYVITNTFTYFLFFQLLYILTFAFKVKGM